MQDVGESPNRAWLTQLNNLLHFSLFFKSCKKNQTIYCIESTDWV